MKAGWLAGRTTSQASRQVEFRFFHEYRQFIQRAEALLILFLSLYSLLSSPFAVFCHCSWRFCCSFDAAISVAAVIIFQSLSHSSWSGGSDGNNNSSSRSNIIAIMKLMSNSSNSSSNVRRSKSSIEFAAASFPDRPNSAFTFLS